MILKVRERRWSIKVAKFRDGCIFDANVNLFNLDVKRINIVRSYLIKD